MYFNGCLKLASRAPFSFIVRLGLFLPLTLVPSESIAPEDEYPKPELPARRNGFAARLHNASDVAQPRGITEEVEQIPSPGTNIVTSDLPTM